MRLVPYRLEGGHGMGAKRTAAELMARRANGGPHATTAREAHGARGKARTWGRKR